MANPQSLDALQPGDRVLVKRNLDHPAWMRLVPASDSDPHSIGGFSRVRDDSLEPLIGSMTVAARMTTVRGDLVRLEENRHVYSLPSGYQLDSEATLIELPG